MMYYLAKFIFWITGWKISENQAQGVNKAVVVSAPHTSMWDFVYARAALFIMKVPIRFTVKKELMGFPLGPILHAFGAIPIDRNHSLKQKKSMVDSMVELFDRKQELLILITPEGTRKYVKRWKTGFYYVAKNAGVPIVLGYLNYEKKVAGLGPVIHPSDSIDYDMERIKDFYRPIPGKYPELGVR